MNEVFLRGIKMDMGSDMAYPFSIPAVKEVSSLNLSSNVTFLVGENGSGKSTLVEAIAVAAGFNAEGGTKNYNFSSQNTTSSLAEKITLIRGARREKGGYFLRAESFYTTANYADSGTFPGPGKAAPMYFNGKRIHEQSHGEAFLSIVNDFSAGLFVFDEPESALSPQRQLALMMSMRGLIEEGSQFIIATHSPILLSYPGATIYELSDRGIEKIKYEDVEHVKLTKDFLNNPNQYLTRLFKQENV